MRLFSLTSCLELHFLFRLRAFIFYSRIQVFSVSDEVDFIQFFKEIFYLRYEKGLSKKKIHP